MRGSRTGILLKIKDRFRLLELTPGVVFFHPCTFEERDGLVKALHAACSHYRKTQRMRDTIYTVYVTRNATGVIYGLRSVEI